MPAPPMPCSHPSGVGARLSHAHVGPDGVLPIAALAERIGELAAALERTPSEPVPVRIRCRIEHSYAERAPTLCAVPDELPPDVAPLAAEGLLPARPATA